MGLLPRLLFLFLPTDGWEPLRRAVLACLAVATLVSWKQLRKGFILSWGTWLFFLLCAIAFYGFKWIWLARHMGVIANATLAGIVWLTILSGKPFTLQYARAELPKERWNDKQLVRSCRSIAVFWGWLLLVPTLLSVFRLYFPARLPGGFYFCASLLCIAVGTTHTMRFKHKSRNARAAATPPANG